MYKVISFLIGFFLLGCMQAQAAAAAVSLKTQEGWSLAALYQPAKADNKTVLLLHDIGQNKERFQPFYTKLEEKGIGYLALDLRGHGQSTNLGRYTSFAKEGVDNGYNKMTRDVDSAMEFLKGKGILEENILWVGAGMGANVAAKAASLWPSVGGIALLTPVANFRDVLPIAALRVYKGNVFIAAASDDKKTFLEASVMRNVAFLTNGEGKVTFATAYDKKGHELLDTWVTPELLQWIQTPEKPPLIPDQLEDSSDMDMSYEPVAQSGTEEALFPSVLGVK